MDWMQLQEHYTELENWYSGVALNDTIQTKTGLIDKYPLHLNPIPGTCEKHAAVLLGNTLESIRAGGVPVEFVPESDDPAVAETVKKALLNAFLGNGGGAQFVENAITSQYMGGCVFGVMWKPENKDLPVQTQAPSPKEFLAYPKGNNFWELQEVWFVREVSWVVAAKYGYPVPESVQRSELSSDPEKSGYKYYYIEHWKEDEYSIQINDQVILDDVDGKKIPMAGANKWEIVPWVYIPHKRRNKFIGDGIVNAAVKGIIKEYNLRNADIGDAVSDDAHAVMAMRGVRTSLAKKQLPDGRPVVDLGSSSGLGANETDPDLFVVQTKSTAEPQLKFVTNLENLYRTEVVHPAVADGIDEGSQRSSVTLTTRMWPLQAHVELERIYWTAGLLRLAKIILTFCLKKGTYDIKAEHLKLPIVIKWATMLPRDRKDLVDELAIRRKNKLTSIKHALEMLGDTTNIEQELDELDDEALEEIETQLKLKPPQPPAGKRDVNDPDAGNRPNKDKE